MVKKVLSVFLAAVFLLGMVLTFVLPAEGHEVKHGANAAGVADPPGSPDGGSNDQGDRVVPDIVLMPADSREHALQIALRRGLELKSYVDGIAVLFTTDPKSEAGEMGRSVFGERYKSSLGKPQDKNDPGPGPGQWLRAKMEIELAFATTAEAGTYGFEFPDAAFRGEVLRILNAMDAGTRNENSFIAGDTAMLSSLEFLDVSDMKIGDMTGLRHLSGLIELHCGYNELTSLDVSGNKALEILDMWANDILSLDLSENKALTVLDCGENALTELDLSGNTALLELWCDSNLLTVLDLTKNLELDFVMCDSNFLTALDVTLNKKLRVLDCRFNDIKSLDVSGNTSLIVLLCAGNLLKQLDVTQNKELRNLDCGFNDLTSLDLSNNAKLENIDVRYNLMPGQEAIIGRPDIEWDKEVWIPAWGMNWIHFMFDPQKDPTVEETPIAWVRRSTGNRKVYIDKPVEFAVKLKATEILPNVNAFSVTVTVKNLSFKGDYEAFDGFTLLKAPEKVELDDGSVQWTFMIITTTNGKGIDYIGESVLLKLSFEAVSLGKASVKLDEVYGTTQVDVTEMTDRTFAFIPAKTQKAFVKIIDKPEFIAIYSKYDLNKDGEVDLLDISIALRVYLKEETDDDWNEGFSLDGLGMPITAALCDVNGDGVVDMLDIADILINFGPAPPQYIDPRD